MEPALPAAAATEEGMSKRRVCIGMKSLLKRKSDAYFMNRGIRAGLN